MTAIETYLDTLEQQQRLLVIALRELILASAPASAPAFTEAIKWHQPTYSINKNICSLAAHKNHVNLQIFRGAELPAVALLSGTGKAMRHLKFCTTDDIDAEKVGLIIQQAVALDAG